MGQEIARQETHAVIQNGKPKQDDLERQFRYLLASGAMPKHITTPHQLFLAYKLLQPLGLDWVINLRNTFYNPTSRTMELCNDAPLAACQRRREEYVGTVEYHVNADNERRTHENFMKFKVEGAVCIAKRKGREDVVGLFTMEQARRAGLLSKDNWSKYPEAMLTKRARAIALRGQWSDVLGGVSIHEADDFVQPKDTAHASSPAAVLGFEDAAPPQKELPQARAEQPPAEQDEPEVVEAQPQRVRGRTAPKSDPDSGPRRLTQVDIEELFERPGPSDEG